MQIKIYQQGISIVETIVALMILAAIGVALMALNVQIQSATNSARFKSVAEAEAQKMLEQVRNEKNRIGANGLKDDCYVDGRLTPSPPSVACTCGPSGINGNPLPSPNQKFEGYVIVGLLGNGKKIESVVGWNQKGKNYCTRLITVLYDY